MNEKNSKPKITLFHCINTIADGASLTKANLDAAELSTVKLACSSMVKDVFLLRAFEAGADAVVVLVCGEDACRYTEGSIRARKRVDYVKGLMDEIGVDGRRLSLFNISHNDESAAAKIIEETVSELAVLGPNPAA
jgi:coenzyme F420-reducing hydrogenase delta subunit